MKRGALLLQDPALPGLAEALEPEAMTPRLAPLATLWEGRKSTPGGSWRVADIKVLKHKPGRRCALGYMLDGPGGRRCLFAKAFSGERGPGIEEVMQEIAAAIPEEALVVPRPLGYLPDLRLLVTEYVEGTPLATSLHEGKSDVAARRIASALALLHGCAASLAGRWSASREVANTGGWLDRSPAGSRVSTGRAAALLERLGRRATLLPEAPEGPVHRDFYAEQVWDCGSRSALLDLDDARFGDPALDVGNFVAHLKLRSLQFPRLAPACERGRPSFLEEYERQRAGSAGVESLRERATFYEAASLLRLSGVYSLRDRWARFLPEALLDSCEAALDAHG